jgi:hypothetical protein
MGAAKQGKGREQRQEASGQSVGFH